MKWRIAIAFAAVLLLGAGVAVGATQLASSSLSEVCVNDTNGLVRAASSCREGEHAMTIGGGGGNVVATQNGTFTLAWGENGGAKTLPLTGVTVSGRCEAPADFGGNAALARVLLESASGTTMDAFAPSGGTNPVGRTSLLTNPISAGGTSPFPAPGNDTRTAVITSQGATASLTLGAYVDTAARTCVFLWQAVEAPN